MTPLFLLVPGPWNGYFWCAAHLLPPGVLHCVHICPLWLPAGLLYTEQRESWRLLSGWKDAPKRVETRMVFMLPLPAQEREESRNVQRPPRTPAPSYTLTSTCVFQVDVVYPNVFVASSMVIPEPANSPPLTYSSGVQGSS